MFGPYQHISYHFLDQYHSRPSPMLLLLLSHLTLNPNYPSHHTNEHSIAESAKKIRNFRAPSLATSLSIFLSRKAVNSGSTQKRDGRCALCHSGCLLRVKREELTFFTE